MTNSHQKNLDEMYQTIRPELVNVFVISFLKYYNNYKNDYDTFEQVCNTINTTLGFPKIEYDLFLKDVIATLEQKYFYKIESKKPLIIKSIL